jgi:squalene synthase HpnC
VSLGAESLSPSAGARSAAAPAPDASAVMAQARAENFPVASLVLPRRLRAHLLALYGFARLVDDAGDEAEGDRLALLEELASDLKHVWNGTPHHPLIARLQPTVRAYGLPIGPFQSLIEANRRDQVVHRYETFEDLLGYCELSANGIGELVLRIFDAATPERLALASKVCSALQLTEHWQDVAEDYANGRIYIPARDRERFGVAEADLAASVSTPELRALMRFEVQRAHQLLDEGAPLLRTLRGRYALAVAAFVAGGRIALAEIERADYEVLRPPARAGSGRHSMQRLRAMLRAARR